MYPGLTKLPLSTTATGAPGDVRSSCKWLPVSDGVFDIHLELLTAVLPESDGMRRGAAKLIQPVIRVVADPLKHCPDGTYPHGSRDSEVPVGMPNWYQGTPFQYLWNIVKFKERNFIQVSQYAGSDGLLELNNYVAFPNYNESNLAAAPYPEHLMTEADKATQNVVKAILGHPERVDNTPTELPLITFPDQVYAIMTTSVLKGCTRCITGIGIAPIQKNLSNESEVFKELANTCPFHGSDVYSVVGLEAMKQEERKRQRQHS